jgi:hypothetical protein
MQILLGREVQVEIKAIHRQDASLWRYKPVNCLPDTDHGPPTQSGVPDFLGRQLFVQLKWEPKALPCVFTMYIRHMDQITANDTNSEAANAYTALNLGAQFQQTSGAWQLNECVRIDKVVNRM